PCSHAWGSARPGPPGRPLTEFSQRARLSELFGDRYRATPRAQSVERLFEQGFSLSVRTSLFDIREVRLERLAADGLWRVLFVQTRWCTTFGAIPLKWNLGSVALLANGEAGR